MRRVVICILFFLAFSISVAAEELQRLPPSIPLASRSQAQQCGFQGNSDLYGLGIRLGYYLQASSIWAANFFALEESRQLRPTTTLFFVAMFIALAFYTHDPSEVFVIEPIIVLLLLVVVWYVGTLDLTKWSQKHFEFEPLLFLLNEFCLFAFVAYNTWFWWVGFEQMKPTPCGTYLWFFAKVKLYGWFTTICRTLVTIGCPSYLMFTLPWRVVQFYNYLQQQSSPLYFKSLAESLEGHFCGNQSAPKPGDSQPINTESTRSSLMARTPSRSDAASPDIPGTAGPADLESKRPSHSGIPSFDQLEAADNFMNAILEPSAYFNAPLFHIYMTKIPVFIIPFGRIFQGLQPRYWKATFGGMRKYIFPVVYHVAQLRRHPWFLYPILIRQAVSALDSQRHKFSPEALHATLTLRLASQPKFNSMLERLWSQTFCGWIIACMIIATELALHWNHTTDILSMGSTGQLVALVLGCGSLGKVFWAWVRARREDYDGAMEGSAYLVQVNRCSETFYALLDEKRQGKLVNLGQQQDTGDSEWVVGMC